jgi:hypothetical protein
MFGGIFFNRLGSFWEKNPILSTTFNFLRI